MLFHCTYNSEYKNKLCKYKLKRGKTYQQLGFTVVWCYYLILGTLLLSYLAIDVNN